LPSSAFPQASDSPGLPLPAHPLPGFLPSQRFLSPACLLCRLRQRALQASHLQGFPLTGWSVLLSQSSPFSRFGLFSNGIDPPFRPSSQGFFPSSKSVRRELSWVRRQQAPCPSWCSPLWGLYLPFAYPPLDFGLCKTCLPEFSAFRHHKGQLAFISFEMCRPLEVFPLARLCFQRPYGLRPALHAAEKK
jgi:hypothetical protein